MGARRKHRLVEVEWPALPEVPRPAPTPAGELRRRIEAAGEAMERRGLSHLVVYADREHFANLAYLTGFDPRYEEALLVLSRRRKPLLLVGNECAGYVAISPLLAEDELRVERFQPFSLLDQPRDSSRQIREILADEGIGADATVGCVGWKYFCHAEHPAGRHAIEIPSYLVDTLRELTSRERVTNDTDLFMHAEYGLRTSCSVWDIAFFEYTNGLASDGARRISRNVKEGMRDDELAKLAHYNAIPLGSHMTVRTGPTMISLSSPSGKVVERGNRLSFSLCYWGSNVCRAGWVASSAADLPPPARAYVEAFAGPYFEAMGEWYARLDVGASGGELAQLLAERLPFDRFGIFLNPGHLIHLDEWVSSPFYRGSSVRLRSAMAIQADVIPSSPAYYSTRMEEGIVLADATLRRELGQTFPDCFARCQARRRFMTDVLGFALPQAVLPLSNIPGIVPPFFLEPNLIFALDPG